MTLLCAILYSYGTNLVANGSGSIINQIKKNHILTDLNLSNHIHKRNKQIKSAIVMPNFLLVRHEDGKITINMSILHQAIFCHQCLVLQYSSNTGYIKTFGQTKPTYLPFVFDVLMTRVAYELNKTHMSGGENNFLTGFSRHMTHCWHETAYHVNRLCIICIDVLYAINKHDSTLTSC